LSTRRKLIPIKVAIQNVVIERLEAEGLEKTMLPLGTTDLTQPHVPILTSVGLSEKSRVVVIFGEGTQDLGILAHRICGRKGGVNQGSMVSVVRGIKKAATEANLEEPGIVLANTGQLWWWPEGKRTLGPVLRHDIPMGSAVLYGRYHDDAVNAVPGHRTPKAHVRYIFEKALPAMLSQDAKIDIIAVNDSPDYVEEYLGVETNWSKWSGRVNSMAILGGFAAAEKVQSGDFKQFLKEARFTSPTSFAPRWKRLPASNTLLTACPRLDSSPIPPRYRHFRRRGKPLVVLLHGLRLPCVQR
jgi:hypothetical protein